jgi:hypothetical protein
LFHAPPNVVQKKKNNIVLKESTIVVFISDINKNGFSLL